MSSPCFSSRLPVFLLAVLFLVAAVLAAPVHAGDPRDALPTLHRVVDVSGDDRLNIREEPDANSPVIETLAPDATGVEVVHLSRDGKWGRINSSERAGWVSMRYLERSGEDLVAGTLPERLRCYGTEPFWTLDWDEQRLTFSRPGADDIHPRLRGVTAVANRRQPNWVIVAEEDGHRLTGVIRAQSCSDGMSDRLYGLGITLVEQRAEGEINAVDGCCSLAR